jgi:predicted  nucleic acid-binding Zn-ribbon protein
MNTTALSSAIYSANARLAELEKAVGDAQARLDKIEGRLQDAEDRINIADNAARRALQAAAVAALRGRE